MIGLCLAIIILGAVTYPFYQTLAAELMLPGIPARQVGAQTEPEQNESDTSREYDEEREGEAELPKVANSLSACLMDADSGRVLYEKNGYQEMPMASTTKIMTCLIVLENADMDEIVIVSKYASTMPDVQLGIVEGEQYYVKDLLYSLMLESHNDTAVALAEHVGGSVEEFCNMMTARAKSLGAMHTSFRTPNGLDADGHYTTAADLALIGSFAIQNETFLKITNTTSYNFTELTKGRQYAVSNKNRFLYMMDGAIGIKTGFTGKAGYCFVGALKRDGKSLVSVVLGCGWPPNKNLKWTDTTALMEYGLSEYEQRDVFEHDKTLEEIPVYGGVETSVTISCEGELSLLMRPDEQVRVDYQIAEYLTAPVGEGTQVGNADYYIGDELIASFPVKTSSGAEALTWKYCIEWAIRAITSGGTSFFENQIFGQ